MKSLQYCKTFFCTGSRQIGGLEAAGGGGAAGGLTCRLTTRTAGERSRRWKPAKLFVLGGAPPRPARPRSPTRRPSRRPPVSTPAKRPRCCHRLSWWSGRVVPPVYVILRAGTRRVCPAVPVGSGPGRDSAAGEGSSCTIERRRRPRHTHMSGMPGFSQHCERISCARWLRAWQGLSGRRGQQLHDRKEAAVRAHPYGAVWPGLVSIANALAVPVGSGPGRDSAEGEGQQLHDRTEATARHTHMSGMPVSFSIANAFPSVLTIIAAWNLCLLM